MNSVKADFSQRASEVRRYFRFVISTANSEFEIRASQNANPALPPEELDELLKTLKASCYLLLYNLVESTMRNMVEAIFDEFRKENLHFDECREEIKRLVLVNFKSRSTDKILAKLQNIAHDVVTETFVAKETFDGNLDAKSIRETAAKFGYVPPTDKTGLMMRSVKENRNDLAHGNKSFSDIGKDTTPDRLEAARKQTVVILFLTIKNVSAYLAGKRYLSRNLEQIEGEVVST